MRFIPVDRLQEGMVLGQPFYGSKFEILLTQGMTLTDYHIQRINEMGYAGVYVEEDSSRDVFLRDLVPPELRLNTIRAAKEFVDLAESIATGKNVRMPKVTKERQEKIIMPLISAIISNDRRMVEMIDLKPYDYYNYYHAANCVILSLLVGLELGISGARLCDLGLAALLHDIGNAFIPKAILEKPDKLNPEEYDVVKSHCERGFHYLRENYDISIDACIGAQHHHENYDGSGYPTGLKKNKISIYGRIISITDAYDALVSRRPFRDALYPVDAIAIMEKRAGTAYDPEIIAALKRVVAPYPPGISVSLDTGVQCVVVLNYLEAPDRPRLRLINNISQTPLYLDLYKDPIFKKNRILKIL